MFWATVAHHQLYKTMYRTVVRSMYDLWKRIYTQLEQPIQYTVNTLEPTVYYNYCVHICPCKSYTDDLTTVPYIGDDSAA